MGKLVGYMGIKLGGVGFCKIPPINMVIMGFNLVMVQMKIRIEQVNGEPYWVKIKQGQDNNQISGNGGYMGRVENKILSLYQIYTKFEIMRQCEN